MPRSRRRSKRSAKRRGEHDYRVRLRPRAKLAKLAAHHGVEPTPAVHIPLAPPSAEDVIVEGYASTPDLDLTKMIFRRGALCWEGDPRDIPLLISHDRDRVAGEILDLRQKPDGLWIKARITDPEARRLGAFSIGGVVSAHTLHNETRPRFLRRSVGREPDRDFDGFCPGQPESNRHAAISDTARHLGFRGPPQSDVPALRSADQSREPRRARRRDPGEGSDGDVRSAGARPDEVRAGCPHDLRSHPAAAADAGPPRNFVFIACKAVRASAVRRTIQ